MNENEVTEFLMYGKKAAAANNFKEADYYYSQILRFNPLHAEANFQLGSLAVKINKPEKALSFFKTAITQNGVPLSVWPSLIDCLIELEKFDEALTLLEHADATIKPKINHGRLKQKILDAHTSAKSIKVVSKHTTQTQIPQQKLQQLINLHRNKKYKKVLNIGDSLLKTYPNSIELLNICAVAAIELKQFQKAKISFNAALEEDPNSYQTLINIGSLCLKQKSLEEAEVYFLQALKLRLDEHIVLEKLGDIYLLKKEIDRASEHYQKAIKIAPQFMSPYHKLSFLLITENKLQSAEQLLKKAINIDTSFILGYVDLALLYSKLDRFESAEKILSLGIKFNHGAVLIYSTAMQLSDKWNKIQSLKSWINQARSQFDVLPDLLNLWVAIYYYRIKKFDAAKENIEKIKLKSLSQDETLLYFETQGKIADKSKDFETAFKYFNLMNQATKESEKYKLYNPDAYFNFHKENLTKLKNSKKQNRSNTLDVPSERAYFLIGFPRSGTTLLDTILRGHSKIELIEEKPCLTNTIEYSKSFGSFDFINSFPASIHQKELREFYINELSGAIRDNNPNALVIDKLPLNILHIPFINFVFPDARYIFCARHPFDTIISNWMQNYHLNNAMANMVDLDRIIDFYRISMETLITAKSKLSMNIAMTKYENLIYNLPKELNYILNFLELRWEAEILNYQEVAIERGRINTPSYSQVIEPLYTRSVNRWKNYAQYLRKAEAELISIFHEFDYAIE